MALSWRESQPSVESVWKVTHLSLTLLQLHNRHGGGVLLILHLMEPIPDSTRHGCHWLSSFFERQQSAEGSARAKTSRLAVRGRCFFFFFNKKNVSHYYENHLEIYMCTITFFNPGAHPYDTEVIFFLKKKRRKKKKTTFHMNKTREIPTFPTFPHLCKVHPSPSPYLLIPPPPPIIPTNQAHNPLPP